MSKKNESGLDPQFIVNRLQGDKPSQSQKFELDPGDQRSGNPLKIKMCAGYDNGKGENPHKNCSHAADLIRGVRTIPLRNARILSVEFDPSNNEVTVWTDRA